MKYFDRLPKQRYVQILYTILFVGFSCLLFNMVYYTMPDYMIDEMFHVPQGIQYCSNNFSAWNNKITTLPGLYLTSTAFMKPFNLCTTYWMRFTNLIGSIVNMGLLVELFHMEMDRSDLGQPLSWLALVSGVNVAILPPLYFFSHFYYTETFSLTAVLLTVIASKKQYHLLSAIIGIYSILMRQTNVVWVLMLLGLELFEILVRCTSARVRRARLQRNRLTLVDMRRSTCNFFANRGRDIYNITREEFATIITYACTILGFVTFVVINGSIVMGDKEAHMLTLHIPQLFYFSLFSAFFSFPSVVLEIRPFFKFIWRRKLMFIGFLITCLIIAHYNTLEHPYLLADNRHYTFYFWNRTYQKYDWMKYVLVGVYLFTMFAIMNRMDPTINYGYLLAYVPCLCVVLMSQKLLDVRYFLIPYILLRLKFKACHIGILLLEQVIYLAINVFSFYVFFTKDIYWDDFSYTQRLIW